MNTATTSSSIDVRDTLLVTGQRIMAAKGFSAVGLNEILTTAGVPKGSFYHYFGSKDAFGVAILEAYFQGYHAEMDCIFSQSGLTMAQRLMNYWQAWEASQSFSDCQGKCLAVKLGAEVADLSEAMRLVMQRGTAGIVRRLADAMEAGVAQGSLAVQGNIQRLAASLYQLWLGASVMAKIMRNTEPFSSALARTRQMLHLPQSEETV